MLTASPGPVLACKHLLANLANKLAVVTVIDVVTVSSR